MKKNLANPIFAALLFMQFPHVSYAESIIKSQVVSSVDTHLDHAQKYYLSVDGSPYYMLNIQMRFDLLRYSEGWNDAACEALMAQVAADGFNTVSIPVHWYEVEKSKDQFHWEILDKYLSWATKYGLKVEMLWFGANSGGHVQWLSRSTELPNHLRTPDYVLYSPKPGSKETTSDYRIRRDMSDYSLDMTDERLCERETYVLGKVMEHVSEWDASHGKKHTLIGVQINNEAIGKKGLFANSEVLSYLNRVAGAVKQSNYVVWTRTNCVYWNVASRIIGNEEIREKQGFANLDFVGIDTYRHHFATDQSFIASMRENVPYVGKNYRMIMETNSEFPYAAQMHLAALSGNTGFDFYSVEGLYGREGKKIKSLVNHIEDICLVNKILKSDVIDIATKSHGYGLFVHNWEGCNSAQSVSNLGIKFKPAYPTSQAISIKRNASELVLMSTKGGIFTLPKEMKVQSLSIGYFKDNQWVKLKDLALSQLTAFDTTPQAQPIIRIGMGETVLVKCEDLGEISSCDIYQAEKAHLSSGAEQASTIDGIGFAGNGFVRFPAFEGSNICWKNIDGKEGGEKTLKIRYSNGSAKTVGCLLYVNGKMSTVKLEQTGAWDQYRDLAVKVALDKGVNNEVKLESMGNYQRIDRVVYPLPAGYIDELKVY